MARPTINDIRSISNFAFNNLWDVTITSPSGVNVDVSDVNFRAVSSGLPKGNFESQEVKIRGHKIKVAGDIAYEGTLTLTLVETDDGKVSKLIKDWREGIWETKTGKGKKKSEYETTVVLRRLKKDGTPFVTYTLYGVYLEDYTPGELSENGEISNLELTLSYDYFKDDIGG